MNEITSQDWLNVIQTVGVIFTLIFATIQMKKSERASKSNSLANVYQRVDMINSLIFHNPEMLNELSKPFVENEDKSKSINSYLAISNTLFYELYFQHKRFKQIDKEAWEGWEKTITKFFAQPYVIGYWKVKRDEYSKGFAEFIEEIIDKNKKILSSDMGQEIELNLESKKEKVISKPAEE